jgi:hypothetical protein
LGVWFRISDFGFNPRFPKLLRRAAISAFAATQLFQVQHSFAQQSAPPRNEQTIADSQNDFSGVQGNAGWSYLFFISNKDGTDLYVPDDSRPMNWSPAKAARKAAWSGPVQWYIQTETGAEPQAINGCFQGWTVRRWTSDRAATLHITGHAGRASKEGDGVGIKVFIDGKELFSKLLPPAAATAVDLTTPVNKGSRLDFVVTPGPGLDANFDATDFRVTILEP